MVLVWVLLVIWLVIIIVLCMDLAESFIVEDSIIVDLILRGLYTGDRGVLGVIKAGCTHKHLGMARVRLIAETAGVETHYAVQHPHLLVAVTGFAEVTLNGKLKNLLETLAISLESCSWPKGSKVVSVYHNGDLQGL